MVTDQTSYVEYSGNNSTSTAYSIPFSFKATSDIKCYVDGVAYTTFTVAGSSVTTTTAIPVASVFRIERDQADEQTMSLVYAGDLSSSVLEATLDKLAFSIQQVRDRVLRALSVSRASTETEPAEMDATTEHYMYIDANGDLVRRTKAQIAADVSAELDLPSTLDRPMAVAADDATRAALVPDFTGQLMVQLDTGDLYRATGTSAGNWVVVAAVYKTFADAAARAAAVPDYVGQMGKQTRGGSWYRAYGTSAGNWDWAGYGNYTPPTAGTWSASLSITAGQVFQAPTQVISAAASGYQLQSATATTAVLDSPDTAGGDDDYLVGCTLTIVSGTGAGQKRRIQAFTDSTQTCTVRTWTTTPDATSVYSITWESGKVLYEAVSSHTSSQFLPYDIAEGTMRVFAVEDYHYHRRGIGTDPATNEVWLMPADRAPDWNGIIREVYGLLPSRADSGVDAHFGTGLAVAGAIHFTEGQYYVHEEVPHVPRCSLAGRQVESSLNSTYCALRAQRNDVVRGADGNDYVCISSHLANNGGTAAVDDGAGDNEPGYGTDAGTYWKVIAGWAASTAYVAGDVVTRSGRYYRCMADHTSATNAYEPPSNGGVAQATAGATWFRYWQSYGTSTPSNWAHNTFYQCGWDTNRDEYLLMGSQNGASALATAGFWSGVKYLFLNCNAACRSGWQAWMSHGSIADNILVDNYSRAGIVIAGSADSHTYRNIFLSHLEYSNPSEYGIYVSGSSINLRFEQIIVNRCETALSFDDVYACYGSGIETENCGLVFDFRKHDRKNLTGSGTAPGSATGCHFVGVHAARNSSDEFVVSTRTLAFVRMNSFSTLGLHLSGNLKDQAASLAQGFAEPYDRVEFQENSGTAETYPLVPHWGYQMTSNDFNNMGFTFELDELRWNLRMWSSNTQSRPSRAGRTAWAGSTVYSQGDVRKHGTTADDGGNMLYVCRVSTNGIADAVSEPGVGTSWETYWREAPGNLVVTGNPDMLTNTTAAAQLFCEPGLYKIATSARNSFGGTCALVVRASPGGTALNWVESDTGRTIHTGATSNNNECVTYLWHQGGQIEYEVTGSGASEIDLYIQPWVRGAGGSTALQDF